MWVYYSGMWMSVRNTVFLSTISDTTLLRSTISSLWVVNTAFDTNPCADTCSRVCTICTPGMLAVRFAFNLTGMCFDLFGIVKLSVNYNCTEDRLLYFIQRGKPLIMSNA